MRYEYERFLRELGARVRLLRKQRGLSHRQMISEHGFHLNQLHRIETGQPVSTQTLLRLCAAFDLRLEELVKDLGVGEEPTAEAQPFAKEHSLASVEPSSKKQATASKQKVAT